MKRRSGRFYRENEREVMERLGLSPTRNSGSGWIEKEDGQSDEVLCQLKSTDAASITIKQHDLHTLEYNALVSHKIPVFAVQFLGDGQVWLMVRPESLQEAASALVAGIARGGPEKPVLEPITDVGDDPQEIPVVKSDWKGRERFNAESGNGRNFKNRPKRRF